MNAKGIVAGVLLAFVAVSVIYMVVQEVRDGSRPAEGTAVAAGAPASADATAAPAPRVTVYYFHWTMRCRTCLSIEQQAEEALRARFADELAAGILAWHSIDVQEAANEHFAKKYDLVTSSLVLVRSGDDGADEWIVLDKVWDLVDERGAFAQYVCEETQRWLES